MHGANSNWAKLRPDEVQEIRRAYDEAMANGEGVYATIRKLGAEYGMAPNTIYYIGKRRTWRSLGEDNESANGTEGT
jgi:hypothetical protein